MKDSETGSPQYFICHCPLFKLLLLLPRSKQSLLKHRFTYLCNGSHFLSIILENPLTHKSASDKSLAWKAMTAREGKNEYP